MSVTHHYVDMQDTTPVSTLPFCLQYQKQDALPSIIDDMLQDNIICPLISYWNSPLFLVDKSDSSFWPVANFCPINQVTQTEIYPLPQLQNCFNTLGDAHFFSTLNLKSRYWQVPLEPDSCPRLPSPVILDISTLASFLSVLKTHLPSFSG